MRPGLIERQEHEYERHGTRCLFADFEVATGKIIAPSIGPTRTNEDFASHIGQTIATDPQAEWIFVVDQLKIHQSEVLVKLIARELSIELELDRKGNLKLMKAMASRRTFLQNPTHRIRFVYTPKHTSWLNHRRNLLRRLASINRSAFRTFKGRIIFVTLTYPHEYPEDPDICKRHLKALRKRLQREYKSFATFWRLGIQQRGAWHFHLLLFVGPSFGPIDKLRRFISSSWYEVTGKVSEGHLRAGTHVEAVKKWREVTSYVERYMAKPEEFPEELETGRIWGVWNEELLPVRWEKVEVSLRDAFIIRRIYRKLARRKGSGSLRRITVFVRHENVLRLLRVLGYCLE